LAVQCSSGSAIALGSTDADGAFTVPGVPAGRLRVTTLIRQRCRRGGEPSLAPDAIGTVNIVISGGLAIVKGVVSMQPATEFRARASAVA
jgi:hypothetical protein